MDLKIELTKLYSLHIASLQLEHAVRQAGSESAEWRGFSPSRFVYAYFTFNSIYAYDWSASVQQLKVIRWTPREATARLPKEADQFKALITFTIDQLGTEAPHLCSELLHQSLQLLGISEPMTDLKYISATNLDRRESDLLKQFSSQLGSLLDGSVDERDMASAVILAARFVYLVRNNIFHGTKTRVEMEDVAQQRRLLIYTSVLTSINGLFFCAVERAVPNWSRVPLQF